MYRNSQKRYYSDHTYFITIKTKDNFPYFKEPVFCELFIEELKLCKLIKDFYLYAFCINYDHVHLIIRPRDKYNISQIIQFLKRHFSRNVNYLINVTNSIDIQSIESEINLPRTKATLANVAFVEKNNQLINNFNKKLINFKNHLIKKYGNNINLFPKFKWQKSFHDHIIRSEIDFDHHFNYTIYNHIKHRLPQNWQYNSSNYPNIIDQQL